MNVVVLKACYGVSECAERGCAKRNLQKEFSFVKFAVTLTMGNTKDIEFNCVFLVLRIHLLFSVLFTRTILKSRRGKLVRIKEVVLG